MRRASPTVWKGEKKQPGYYPQLGKGEKKKAEGLGKRGVAAREKR